MSGDVLVDEVGRPVEVCGIAVPYSSAIRVAGVREAFAPGAFAHRSGGLGEAALRWDHGDDERLALAGAEHIEWHDTVRGLLFTATLPTTSPYCHAILRLARQGALQCSIYFRPVDVDADGTVQRATLEHVAMTTEPVAYPTTAWCDWGGRLTPRASMWRRHLARHRREVA